MLISLRPTLSILVSISSPITSKKTDIQALCGVDIHKLLKVDLILNKHNSFLTYSTCTSYPISSVASITGARE